MMRIYFNDKQGEYTINEHVTGSLAPKAQRLHDDNDDVLFLLLHLLAPIGSNGLLNRLLLAQALHCHVLLQFSSQSLILLPN